MNEPLEIRENPETRPFPRECAYCGHLTTPTGNMPWNYGGLGFTRQHIIAKKRGGSDRRENLKTCCAQCNATLNALNDCPGAVAAMRALGEGLGFGKGNPAAIGAARRIELAGSHFDKSALREYLRTP